MSAGWHRGVSCWRPECVLTGLMSEAKVPARLSKLFSGCRPLLAAFCQLIFFARFLPAGFVSHEFRHIVNDTNYKERGIFYG